jgi:ribosomal protein S18 acetylase RimI-like enzyme
LAYYESTLILINFKIVTYISGEFNLSPKNYAPPKKGRQPINTKKKMTAQDNRKKNYVADKALNNDHITTKRVLATGPVLETQRATLSNLYMRSFSLAYRDLQLDLPQEQTLDSFLEHSFNATWSLIQSGKLQLWVEVSRGSSELVVGFMCIQTKDDICYIEQFVVHPDYQRIKIGSNLLKVVTERYHLIWLHTRHINEVAISFYTRHGFIRSDADDDDSVYPTEFPSRSSKTYLLMKKVLS